MNVERLARQVLGVLFIASLGVFAELLLLGHYEDWRQWLPLVVVAVGALAAAAAAARPNRRTAKWMSTVAFVQIPVGLLGVYFHLADNFEFERERETAASGLELFRASLSGALPALAPGALVLLGLLGLVAGTAVGGLSTQRRRGTEGE